MTMRPMDNGEARAFAPPPMMTILREEYDRLRAELAEEHAYAKQIKGWLGESRAREERLARELQEAQRLANRLRQRAIKQALNIDVASAAEFLSVRATFDSTIVQELHPDEVIGALVKDVALELQRALKEKGLWR